MSVALFALVLWTLPTAHAGGYLSGGITTSPAPELSAFTGVPSFQVGIGRKTTGWAALRFANVDIDNPGLVLTGVEPQIGIRQTFGDISTVHPISNVGVYI